MTNRPSVGSSFAFMHGHCNLEQTLNFTATKINMLCMTNV